MLSDQQIIELVLKGKIDKFSELVSRYQKPVYKLAYSILSNNSDAEDAAQETFIKAYNNLSTYTDKGKFWGWLRRITINMCIRRVRPVVLTSLEDVDELGDDGNDSVYESVVSVQENDDLRRMIFSLPPAYRSVIVLKYLEDMSYVEIAEALDESIQNIQVRLFRAKKMLRERMKVCAL